jgi:hypothetical protein
MKLRTLIFLLCACSFACKAKDSIEDDLKNTMQAYLYSGVNNDSSNVKYHVEKVIYFDDTIEKRYVCVFTVHMKEKLFDTTGEMKAYISKDLKTVKRLY